MDEYELGFRICRDMSPAQTNLKHGSQGHLVSKTKSLGSLVRHGSRTELRKQLLAGPKKETHGSRNQGRSYGDLSFLVWGPAPSNGVDDSAPSTEYMAEAWGQVICQMTGELGFLLKKKPDPIYFGSSSLASRIWDRKPTNKGARIRKTSAGAGQRKRERERSCPMMTFSFSRLHSPCGESPISGQP